MIRKFIQSIFNRRKKPPMNIVSVHLPHKPDAEQCATALRVIFILAGADTFNAACEMLPNVPGLGDVVAPVGIESAGFKADTDEGTSGTVDAPTTDAPAPAFDSKGLPWDERIHSGTKGVNKDGSWKQRRGVQEAVVTKVEAELRGKNPAPAAAPPPPPPADIPASLDRRAPPPPPPAAPAVSGAIGDLPKLMQKVTPLMASKKITMVDIAAMCVDLGFPSLVEMNKSPEKATYFPMLAEMIDAKVAA
jgi:hypothetical protein